MATSTPNKGYQAPVVNADLNVWGNQIDTTFNIMDSNLGGTANITLTGGTVVATATQAQSLIQSLTGTLTSNATYTLPALGGFYFIKNNTTGVFTVSIASSGAGSAQLVAQGTAQFVVCDGTNILYGSPPLPLYPPTALQETTVTISGNTTLTATQAAANLIVLIGTLTAPATVTFPGQTGSWNVVNDTAGGFPVILASAGAGTTLPLPSGQAVTAITGSAGSTILLPTGYRRYRLTIQGAILSTNGQMVVNTSTNGGATFSTTGYTWGGAVYPSSGTAAASGSGSSPAANIPLSAILLANSDLDAVCEIYPGAPLIGTCKIRCDRSEINAISQFEHGILSGSSPDVGVNALRISSTGTFSGTFILEGLP
jgi:hypothetical protein